MDTITAAATFCGFMFAIAAAGLIADYILPRLPRLMDWVDSLPMMEEVQDAIITERDTENEHKAA